MGDDDFKILGPVPPYRKDEVVEEAFRAAREAIEELKKVVRKDAAGLEGDLIACPRCGGEGTIEQTAQEA